MSDTSNAAKIDPNSPSLSVDFGAAPPLKERARELVHEHEIAAYDAGNYPKADAQKYLDEARTELLAFIDSLIDRESGMTGRYNPETHRAVSIDEIRELRDALTDFGSLLYGWHGDGTTWSEWDESVRQKLLRINTTFEWLAARCANCGGLGHFVMGDDQKVLCVRCNGMGQEKKP